MEESSRIGEVLAGKYRLDEELGRGGMGAVYRAFHLRVHKEFAVKVLLSEAAEHRSIATRFFLEAQAAGRIGHPGILDVYDVGEDEDGTPFIVMELLRGEPLASLLRRERIAPRVAVWIAARVLEVLDAAHGAGVVHRDVKPQNVFLCEAPGETRSVKLLDFGIAKFSVAPDASAITRSGEIIGSPLYMAPEQAKGEADVDARADVWSVGAMLFEMLTGAAAHVASSPVAVLAKILTQPAPRPSERGAAISAALDAVVTRALSIDRDARFPSARAMLDALRAAGRSAGWSDAPPVFTPVPGGETTKRPRDAMAITSTVEAPLEAAITNEPPSARKRPVAWMALAAVALAVLVPWIVPGWRATRTPAPPPAEASREPPPPAPAPEPVASASAPASAPAASAPAPAPASGSAAAPPSPVSKPRCRAGEVLSSGHCCPRGLVWQEGRCERPLATSF